ncbi:response regulator [Phenylobacterium sp. J367]|uniref:response regulator n=1 Tax=Phenylobacterium sp. J367 TaxID=2898435 RepID=UPI002151D9C1|nr:response regulator [Phenylobacterium sp. J367]MCR5879637.1 response regulator [Phenylobacterium sp. J367]
MLKIIILEEDPVDAVLLREEIERAGHQVAGWAINVEDMLSLLARHDPDLLILDAMSDVFAMSNETLRSIRSHTDVDVVLLTREEDIVHEALGALQPIGILRPPVQPEALRALLGRVKRRC